MRIYINLIRIYWRFVKDIGGKIGVEDKIFLKNLYFILGGKEYKW